MSNYSVIVGLDIERWSDHDYRPEQYHYFENITMQELKEKMKPIFIEYFNENHSIEETFVTAEKLEEKYETSFSTEFFSGKYPIVIVEDKNAAIKKLVSFGLPVKNGKKRSGRLFDDARFIS